MFHQEIAWQIHRERIAQAERRARLGAPARRPSSRRSVRNGLGRGLIRIGSLLAAEGPREPAAQR